MTVHVDTDGGIRVRLLADPTIAGLVGDRIFPGLATAGSAFPRIVYSRISSRELMDLGGPSGLGFPRVQIDIYDRSKGTVKAIRKAVRESIDGYQGPLGDENAQLVRYVDEREFTEPAADGRGDVIHRISMDFITAAETSRPNRIT